MEIGGNLTLVLIITAILGAAVLINFINRNKPKQ